MRQLDARRTRCCDHCAELGAGPMPSYGTGSTASRCDCAALVCPRLHQSRSVWSVRRRWQARCSRCSAGVPSAAWILHFPSGGLLFMFAEDSGAAAVITSRPLAGVLAGFTGRLLCIEDLRAGDCATARVPASGHQAGKGAYRPLSMRREPAKPKGWIGHGSVVNSLTPDAAASGRAPSGSLAGCDYPQLRHRGARIAGPCPQSPPRHGDHRFAGRGAGRRVACAASG